MNVYLFIIRSNKDRLLVFGCYVFVIYVLLFLSKLVPKYNNSYENRWKAQNDKSIKKSNPYPRNYLSNGFPKTTR